ncbi:MAG: ABC transporter permease [Chloroflexi bacterium]|nr:ABC transporter permease [Chloroflexota bacterium]
MHIRIERRLTPSRLLTGLTLLLSLILSLIVGGMLLRAVGADPIKAYRAMLLGALGSKYSLSETLVKAIPLMLCGLGISVAFRMRFWNIGAEGQLAMGGIAAAGIALFVPPRFPGLSAWQLLPMIVAGGFAAGALWGLIPALLKAYIGVNEIITSLMLNYVAILLVEYLFYGPWKDPKGYGFPGTAEFPPAAWLPRLPGTRVHLGLVFALLAAGFIWLVLARTKWGYEIRVIGENPRAASYAGISIVRNVVLIMCLSGGLAGLAGAAEVTAIARRLTKGLTVGYGFTAIIVAWLAKLNPLAVLVVAFFLAALLVGGDQIQITMGLPAAVALILQGAILFFMLGGEMFRQYDIVVGRKPTASPEEKTQP